MSQRCQFSYHSLSILLCDGRQNVLHLETESSVTREGGIEGGTLV